MWYFLGLSSLPTRVRRGHNPYCSLPPGGDQDVLTWQFGYKRSSCTCFVLFQIRKCSNVPNHHTNIFFFRLVWRCEQIYFHLNTFLWSASPLHYNLSTVSHGVTHASSFCHTHNSLRAHLFTLHLKMDKYVLNIHHWPHTITSPFAMDGNGYLQPPMSSLLLSNLLAVPVRSPSTCLKCLSVPALRYMFVFSHKTCAIFPHKVSIFLCFSDLARTCATVHNTAVSVAFQNMCRNTQSTKRSTSSLPYPYYPFWPTA